MQRTSGGVRVPMLPGVGDRVCAVLVGRRTVSDIFGQTRDGAIVHPTDDYHDMRRGERYVGKVGKERPEMYGWEAGSLRTMLRFGKFHRIG